MPNTLRLVKEVLLAWKLDVALRVRPIEHFVIMLSVKSLNVLMYNGVCFGSSNLIGGTVSDSPTRALG